MELVYLWVEKYNNIKEQGFNFSPRFECKYENNELTIYDKKGELAPKCKDDDYIESFFGKNINITAIVGKNGSGKSSIFEAFDFSWEKVYYIYYKNGHLYSNYFKKDKNNRPIIDGQIIVGLDVIYMHKFFFMQMNQNNIFSSLYKNNLYVKKFKSINLKENELNPENFHKNILKLILKQTYLPLKFFNPKNISLKFNIANKKLNLFNLFDLDIDKISKQSKIFSCPKCYYKIYLKSLELLEAYRDKKLSENENNSLVKQLKDFIIQDKDKILKYDYYINEDFYYSIDDESLFEFIEKIFPIKNKQIKIGDFYTKYLKKNNKSYYEIFYYLSNIGFLEYEIYDENKKFSSLSTGEKTLFTDFCLLTEKLNEEQKYKEYDNEIKERIILLDEPDLTLHPEWQKIYIEGIIFVLKKYKDINFHLIVTTHSPFILSDLPKENIIFIENGKQVKGVEKKQTFGANIHTLLSDSFFMENGLMGEFAKGKIDEVIKLLNKEKLDEKELKYCEQIISIIGEPIVKNQLQQMLTDKKISYLAKDTREEIEFLKHRIDLLSKRL